MAAGEVVCFHTVSVVFMACFSIYLDRKPEIGRRRYGFL